MKVQCECGRWVKMPQPTKKQMEAYRLVYIHQSSYEQAGMMMGVTTRAVYYLIERLKILRPDLFTVQTCHIKGEKPISYDKDMDEQIRHKF